MTLQQQEQEYSMLRSRKDNIKYYKYNASPSMLSRSSYIKYLHTYIL